MGIAGLDYRRGGASLDINGIIEDYYVYAGKNVSVGDFVEFVNGIGTVEYKTASTVSLGKLVEGVSACAIDNERVFLCGSLDASSNKGMAVVVTISGEKITYGTEVTFTDSSIGGCSACLADKNAVVVTRNALRAGHVYRHVYHSRAGCSHLRQYRGVDLHVSHHDVLRAVMLPDTDGILLDVFNELLS